jgi:hypothetical protein
VKLSLTNHPEVTEQEQEDTKSMRHISYTPNPIPTPYMQKRKNKEGKTRKKETSTPNVTKTHTTPLATNEGHLH